VCCLLRAATMALSMTWQPAETLKLLPAGVNVDL
jgi:hypothetical protein